LPNFHEILSDGGPVYAETNLSNIIAEPWNALSSLAFLIPVVIWLIRIQGNYRKHAFLTFCLPLLFLGGLGSTLFHAFRASSILLQLDVLPIVLLTFSVSIYFWYRILKTWWKIVLAIAPFILVRLFIYKVVTLSGHDLINLNYFVTGVMIFLPCIILLIKTRFMGITDLIVSCLLMILALYFRGVDSGNFSLLPMGTHWLWHVASAAGSGFLGKYLYDLNSKYLQPIENKI